MTGSTFWNVVFVIMYLLSVYTLLNHKNYKKSMKWYVGGHLPIFYIALIIAVNGTIMIIIKLIENL
jgi:hypothetical protein